MQKEITADIYFTKGCGRCSLWDSPSCKVNTWKKELELLRSILLSTGLIEEIKWSQPVYTYENTASNTNLKPSTKLKRSNVILLFSFKEYCGLSFFKGSLLKDPNKILTQQTENVQVDRQIRFTNLEDILKLETIIRDYIADAIEIEQLGLKPILKKTSDFTIPEEFQNKLDTIPTLKAAFNTLTPGRQRGYLLYFSGAKQSKTRDARIEKYIPKIMAGKGLEDE